MSGKCCKVYCIFFGGLTVTYVGSDVQWRAMLGKCCNECRLFVSGILERVQGGPAACQLCVALADTRRVVHKADVGTEEGHVELPELAGLVDPRDHAGQANGRAPVFNEVPEPILDGAECGDEQVLGLVADIAAFAGASRAT